jgi:hypothetical protein
MSEREMLLIEMAQKAAWGWKAADDFLAKFRSTAILQAPGAGS